MQVQDHLLDRLEDERSSLYLDEWLEGHNERDDWDSVIQTAPLPSLRMIRTQYDKLQDPGDGYNPYNDEILFSIAGLPSCTSDLQFDVGPQDAACCPSAEWRFRSMLDNVAGSTDKVHEIIKVFHTDIGEPVFIEKERGANTAMSLLSVRVSGICVPKGSIVELHASEESLDSAASVMIGDTNFVSVLLGEVSVAPSRVSPWAYEEPLDRGLFACEEQSNGTIEVDSERLRMLAVTDLEDFRQAARSVIALTGLGGTGK
jgi:hypothetical protein